MFASVNFEPISNRCSNICKLNYFLFYVILIDFERTRLFYIVSVIFVKHTLYHEIYYDLFNYCQLSRIIFSVLVIY